MNSADTLQFRLPRRPRQSHKGDFGRVLILAEIEVVGAQLIDDLRHAPGVDEHRAQNGLLRLYAVGHLPQQQLIFLKRHGITFSFYGRYSTLQVRRAHSLIRKNRHSEAVTDVTAVGIRIQNIRENGLPRQSADWLAMTTAPYHLS